MNYLAHAFLSWEKPEMLVGNMISDFVKGKRKYDLPQGIQNGIMLHRAIDEFTDRHEITREAKSFFRKDYGLYSGPLVDVVYDHFLANDAEQFPGAALALFAERTYGLLRPYQAFFPEKFARIFPYMQSQNWLYHYRFKEGIVNSFAGLARRAAYMPSPKLAEGVLEACYRELGACYAAFFPTLKDFAFKYLQQLLSDPDSVNFVG